MTPAFSLYLDAMRTVAALVVLLSHWAYARFTDGHYLFLREWNLGSDAVMIFFVLSGLVISHTVRTKDITLSAFTFARTTRILSVAWPAIILTVLLDQIGNGLNPAAYQGWWYQGDNIGVRILAASTFLNQIWFTDLRLGSNGPFWSLSYEVWYYIMFASGFFIRSHVKWLLLMAICIFVGPRILLLLPAWLLGVWVERNLDQPASYPRLWAILPPLLYICLQVIDAPDWLRAFTVEALGSDTVRLLAFSDEFIWNNLLALLTAIHLLGISKLNIKLPRPDFIRWIAGGSFTLYLLHYPLLQFTDAALPETPALWRHAALLFITIAGCLVIAAATERKLPQLRSILRRNAAI